MQTLITVIHCVTCLLIVLLVLVQSGKGAEISASFSGSSQTVFGSSGGANFFVRFTQVAAAIFFATSLGLTVLGSHSSKSVFDRIASPAPLSAPAANPPTSTSPDAVPATAPTAAAPAAPAASDKK